MKKLMTMGMAYAFLISCTQTARAVKNDTTLPWDFIPERTSTPKPTRHIKMAPGMPVIPFLPDNEFTVIDEFGDDEFFQAPVPASPISPSMGSTQGAPSSPFTTSLVSSADMEPEDTTFTDFFNAHAHMPAATPDTTFDDEVSGEAVSQQMIAVPPTLHAGARQASRPVPYNPETPAYVPSGATPFLHTQQPQTYPYVSRLSQPQAHVYPMPAPSPLGYPPHVSPMLMMNGGPSFGAFVPVGFIPMPHFRPQQNEPYVQPYMPQRKKKKERNKKG